MQISWLKWAHTEREEWANEQKLFKMITRQLNGF